MREFKGCLSLVFGLSLLHLTTSVSFAKDFVSCEQRAQENVLENLDAPIVLSAFGLENEAELEQAYQEFLKHIEIQQVEEGSLADSADSPIVMTTNRTTHSLDSLAALPVPTPTDRPTLGKPKNPGYLAGYLGMLKNLPGDFKLIVKSSLHMSPESLKKALFIVSLTTASMVALDEPMRSFMQSHRSDFSNKLASVVRNGGEPLYVLPALTAGYGAASLLFKDERMKEATLRSIEGVGVSSILTSVLKFGFHRIRPYEAETSLQFKGPSLDKDDAHLSFSSGHTSTAFAVATAFSQVYGDHKLVPVLAYGAATLVGLSRIHDNKHWLSDTIFGATLGITTTKLIGKRRDENRGITINRQSGAGKGVNIGVRLPLPHLR